MRLSMQPTESELRCDEMRSDGPHLHRGKCVKGILLAAGKRRQMVYLAPGSRGFAVLCLPLYFFSLCTKPYKLSPCRVFFLKYEKFPLGTMFKAICYTGWVYISFPSLGSMI